MKFFLLLLTLILAACGGPSILTKPIQTAEDQVIAAAILKVSDDRVKGQLKVLLEQGTAAEKQQFTSGDKQYEFPERFAQQTQLSKPINAALVCRTTRVCGEEQIICGRVGRNGECLAPRVVRFCWWEPIVPCEPVCTPGHAC